VELLRNNQSCALPNTFFSLSLYLNNQRVDEWIDPVCAHGGRYVRAAISNVTPAVWMQALSGRAHFVDRTYHMNERVVAGITGNPKTLGRPEMDKVRRAARQRAKSKKRGG